MSYFDKFATKESDIRAAVGENFANYRIADEMHDAPNKRVKIGNTVYAHGSPEPIPGQVRAPGVRRVGKGPARKKRFSLS
jgi:hypothetical protein